MEPKDAADEMRKALGVMAGLLTETQVVVFTAPTGCGKSTRIPRYLAEKEGHTGLKVVCTQPRRIAATSLAKHVAHDMGTNERDGFVSYKIRFDDTTNSSTRLVFMTDGALYNELKRGDDLVSYSTVVVDEAHERSNDTELVLCLLKEVLGRRKSLKLIIMSATLNAQLFLDYFPGSKLVEVKDIQMFPVEIYYQEVQPRDVVVKAAEVVADLHLIEPDGHILVFFAGVEEIDRCSNLIMGMVQRRATVYGCFVPKFDIRKLHAKLTPEDQKLALEEPGMDSWNDEYGVLHERPIRKVVLATNIAEASITVPSLGYVVDGGTMKRIFYDWKIRQEALLTVPIDQASAQQRSGRTGRTCLGRAYRLYTQEHFETTMLATRPPDIVQSDPTELVLKLTAFGVKSVAEFDFIEAPHHMAILRGISTLHDLGTFSPMGSADLLSNLGKKMAKMTTTPEMAVSLDRAQQLGCVGLMMALAAMLEESIDCFLRPKLPRDNAIFAQAHRPFQDPKSEHWRLVMVFILFKRNAEENRDRCRGSQWCRQHRVVFPKLKAALRYFDRLQRSCTKFNWGVNEDQLLNPSVHDRTKLMKALVKGNFMRIALRRNEFSRDAYTSVYDNLPVVLNYSSQENIRECTAWILYSSIFCQRKVYKVSCCSVIEQEWLVSEASDAFVEDKFRPVFVKEAVKALRA